ncbi:AraC family transcriptional regulator [Pelomonas sp. SE-A7]|uniref:helix-turn-helix domain-containing protein n=1 Tax=Pelomonas sp. SE-A7 TaxID=3054953 RepID=UPI00259CF54A|nr:AraC family transcriptional regulator [Pelomonas sp. SE-A7]MDM4765037.1 AraC family transcriptional regulator ligand-binding domain-containing protein [Pelomonas sp. SE-A7]
MLSPTRRIPARYFALMLDALREQCVDVARLLRMAGLEAARFERADAKLGIAELDALVSTARRVTGRGDLGFQLGGLIKMNSHQQLGYGMLSCASWHEAMKLVARHYHLMNEAFALRYRRTDPQAASVSLYTPLIDMPLETLHFLYETLALAHHNQVQLMLGGEVPAYDVYLPMPAPPHKARYQALAPVRFHFEQDAPPGVRVVMPPELLDRPLAMADPRLVREVDQRCSALAQRPGLGGISWGDYIGMMLRESEGLLLTLSSLAQRVNVSARTIDRQLKKEGLSFRHLADKIRFERACELLSEPGASASEVGLLLGFSSVSNFSRAFRRVVGVSPARYQRGGRAPA